VGPGQPNHWTLNYHWWEEAFFVEKCPGCFAAVVAHGQA